MSKVNSAIGRFVILNRHIINCWLVCGFSGLMSVIDDSYNWVNKMTAVKLRTNHNNYI